MSKSIQLDSDGNDITCMKEFDALKDPCDSCDRTDCEEIEENNGNINDFWWDYKIMKRKTYCSMCYGTGRDYVTIGAKCRECGGSGEVILEDKYESNYI